MDSQVESGMAEINADTALKDLQKRFPAALDYLTTIFLINREYGEVSNGRLARALEVTKPAVSQAVTRLKKQNLAEQDLYGTIRLTPLGRIIAARIIKRHYLLEHLLIRKLGYPWEKSDQEAQLIQRVISDDLSDYLFNLFDQPETCPHGNPFPGSPRENELVHAPRLDQAPVDQRVRLLRITEEGEAREGLLLFCRENHLEPGVELMVKAQESRCLDVICNDLFISIPREFAHYLCYEASFDPI